MLKEYPITGGSVTINTATEMVVTPQQVNRICKLLRDPKEHDRAVVTAKAMKERLEKQMTKRHL